VCPCPKWLFPPRARTRAVGRDVWRLTAELLLVLATAVTLGFESHGTYVHFILSDGCGCFQNSSVLELTLFEDWLTDWMLSCCWPLPAEWSLVPSPMGIMTIFFCLTALGAFRLFPVWRLSDRLCYKLGYPGIQYPSIMWLPNASSRLQASCSNYNLQFFNMIFVSVKWSCPGKIHLSESNYYESEIASVGATYMLNLLDCWKKLECFLIHPTCGK
jgi:hypothetical protein